MDARDEETGNANDRNRPRGSVSSFLLISLILFLLTSHNGEEFLARHHYQDAVTSLENQLSNYTAWLNGTESKFTMPEPDLTVPPLLDVFHIQGHTVDTSRESYYPNITGYVRGNAQFYNITPMALEKNASLSWRPLAERYVAGSNVTEMVEMSSTWNWTASNKMIMTLHEKKAPALQNDSSDSRDLVAVHARMEFTDAETQETLRLELDGVHFLSQGSIIGLVEPFGQPLDIRSLPSIVPPDRKNETAQIIAPELEQRITKLKNMIDDGLIDNESGKEDTPKSKCPFTFHAQFHPVPIPDYLMQDLESEIQHPTGISTVKAPKMVLSAVLLSRECGILYEIHSTQGLRSQTFFNKMTTYGGLSALAYFTALIVFSRQVERSRSPSGIPRVSRWTFLTNATIDAVCFAGHITFAILAEGRASLALMATAFLSCVLFVQEAQFAALIFQIQGPESAPSPPPPPPQTTQAAASTTGNQPSSDDPAPPPAQQRNDDPNSSFFRFFIHHVRTDPQARLWIILFLFLTVLVRVILSPALSMLFVAVTYTFIWSPQIWRSARKGRTSGLTAEYVFGTTICRLAGALYFLTCPYNVLDVEPRGWAYWLAVVVLLQAGIIVLQEHIGPSFFLPSKYQAAKLYDYHPPMPLPDSEAPEKSLGDCSICMDAIYVDPSVRPRASQDHDEKGSSVSSIGRNTVATANGLFNAVQRGVTASSSRREYSLAPCHHLFHTECLEKWLAIKTICPQCRRPLPPL
ncbi:DSC E3 ubiquitin ligase complex subunit 1 [Leucoagaricus sp. SymC.cos]|nr:DSC E3 ubiquitin ligase complex subunit 1 [Leucoagaricus sp. SymC.cos]